MTQPESHVPRFTYSFTCVSEETPPVVVSRSPAPDTNEVAVNSNISFEIDDNDSGVNIGTINVTIEGIHAVINGVIQSGYQGSVTPDGSGGYDVAINPGTN